MGITGTLSMVGKVFYRRKFGLENWRASVLRLINYRDPKNQSLMKQIFFRNDLMAVLLSVGISTPEMLRQAQVAPTEGMIMLGVIGLGGFIHYVFEDRVDKFLENLYSRVRRTLDFLRTLARDLKNRIALELVTLNPSDEIKGRLGEEVRKLRREARVVEEDIAELTGMRTFATQVLGGNGRGLGAVGAGVHGVVSGFETQSTERRSRGGGGGCRALFM